MYAAEIEKQMLQLSALEHTLEAAKERNENIKDPADLDLVMKHRMKLAKLEDTFFEGEDDDDDDGDDRAIDRRRRFERAYQIALSTDTQGYQYSGKPCDRTPQELTAVSWAAFCSELLPEEDAMVRLEALNCENLGHRLKIANVVLRRKKALLLSRMEKAGLKATDDES